VNLYSLLVYIEHYGDESPKAPVCSLTSTGLNDPLTSQQFCIHLSYIHLCRPRPSKWQHESSDFIIRPNDTEVYTKSLHFKAAPSPSSGNTQSTSTLKMGVVFPSERTVSTYVELHGVTKYRVMKNDCRSFNNLS
jgi:hypothetical protein